jgi:hypothetical protein
MPTDTPDPDEFIVIDESDIVDDATSIRDQPTLTRCPSCERCHGCGGRTMVTKERAAYIRARITAQGGPHQ